MRKAISVFSLLMSLLMCFSLPVTASAQTVSFGIAQPYYEKAKSATATLTVSGTTATLESKTDGYPNVVKITAEQTLERQGFLWIWSAYGETFTKTVNSDTLSMLNTKTGLSGGKYRLKTVFTLTDSSGKTETITVYSAEKSV